MTRKAISEDGPHFATLAWLRAYPFFCQKTGENPKKFETPLSVALIASETHLDEVPAAVAEASVKKSTLFRTSCGIFGVLYGILSNIKNGRR